MNIRLYCFWKNPNILVTYQEVATIILNSRIDGNVEGTREQITLLQDDIITQTSVRNREKSLTMQLIEKSGRK